MRGSALFRVCGRIKRGCWWVEVLMADRLGDANDVRDGRPDVVLWACSVRHIGG
jgi:hypothetical protein